jgi:hypothetical protein
MIRSMSAAIIAVLLSTLCPAQKISTGVTGTNALSTGDFNWVISQPLLEPMEIDGENWLSVKDPSIIRYKGKWHLFCTVRGTKRSHAVIYLTFDKWPRAKTATQQVLKCHPGYFCAPHVFYFTPHKKWFMICQASNDSWNPKYGPAYSTTSDITKPDSWSKLTPLFKTKPANINAWLDFWVICDDTKAHLFFTSLNGKMWRSETSLSQFPAGWSTPVLALQGDVFEAGHTYRLAGSNKYLTLIEAQHGHGWRYYKAYLTDRLDGNWTPLAAEKDKSFASMLNVKHPDERWTDVISHGELLRAGYDEKLIVDPDNLRLLFQGVTDRARAGKNYGQIPWKLGILKSSPASN